jgi:hypothetical protein
VTKAIKAGLLAISAESLGNEHEAEQAARTAGALARKAGADLDQLYSALPGISAAALSWNSIVDGWYDAA